MIDYSRVVSSQKSQRAKSIKNEEGTVKEDRANKKLERRKSTSSQKSSSSRKSSKSSKSKRKSREMVANGDAKHDRENDTSEDEGMKTEATNDTVIPPSKSSTRNVPEGEDEQVSTTTKLLGMVGLGGAGMVAANEADKDPSFDEALNENTNLEDEDEELPQRSRSRTGHRRKSTAASEKSGRRSRSRASSVASKRSTLPGKTPSFLASDDEMEETEKGRDTTASMPKRRSKKSNGKVKSGSGDLKIDLSPVERHYFSKALLTFVTVHMLLIQN